MQRIWIVEDDPGIREVMAEMLTPRGYEVLQLEGSDVVGMTAIAPPDLVIVDLWMKTMRGEQVVDYLRAQPETATVPIIVCSALREGEQRARQLRTLWLDKPFGFDDLLAIVQDALEGERP